MYCATCGTPVATGLSFCNRCGNNLNKEREGKKSKGVTGNLISAVVLVGLFGLGVIVGGAIALKQGAGFSDDLVGMFMVLSFSIIGFVEVFLARQLSRVLDAGRRQDVLQPGMPQPLFQPAQVSVNEVRAAAQLRSVPEPVVSVTENTTRTLDQMRGQSFK
jgi:predicted nucleic acid-binding Zn ribbon protein